jgi:hypothetical protein
MEAIPRFLVRRRALGVAERELLNRPRRFDTERDPACGQADPGIQEQNPRSGQEAQAGLVRPGPAGQAAGRVQIQRGPPSRPFRTGAGIVGLAPGRRDSGQIIGGGRAGEGQAVLSDAGVGIGGQDERPPLIGEPGTHDPQGSGRSRLARRGIMIRDRPSDHRLRRRRVDRSLEGRDHLQGSRRPHHNGSDWIVRARASRTLRAGEHRQPHDQDCRQREPRNGP